MKINPSISLNNNIKMPRLGLGTWQMKAGKETESAVLSALKSGYRMIDTAAYYKNEMSVADAIAKSGLKRQEVFITTKLAPGDTWHPIKAFENSLKALKTDYIDLYLIHWPFAPRLKTWQKLEELYQSGWCRAIGVSNFTIRHLEGLLKHGGAVPMVNQFELHPYLYQEQEDLVKFCQDHGIAVTAYAPLTHGKRLDDPSLQAIAKSYKKTAAQIMLRWALEHEAIVIPKASQAKHILENSKIFDFELGRHSMSILDNLPTQDRIYPNPHYIP